MPVERRWSSGITGTCPYGIGACWGGAYDALGRLDGVGFVNPVPDTADSTAQVFLTDDGLPDLNTWTEQFYRHRQRQLPAARFRGHRARCARERDGSLLLRDSRHRPEVQLGPLSIDKVQWDRATAAPQAPEQRELRAYDELVAAGLADGTEVTVTGPLTQAGSRSSPARPGVRGLKACGFRTPGESLVGCVGPLQARPYRASGHIELAGPDLDGNPLANVVTFQPPSVSVSGATLTVGRTLASRPGGDGLELDQELGQQTITARLTFPHDGVMRYEIVDWGGLVAAAHRDRRRVGCRRALLRFRRDVHRLRPGRQHGAHGDVRPANVCSRGP